MNDRNISFTDPWLEKVKEATKLPDDAIFACAYDLHIFVDLIAEAAFFHRTETSDELWVAAGLGIPVVEGTVATNATPSDLVGTDLLSIGRVYAAEKMDEGSSSCLALLERLFRARVNFHSPQRFLVAGIVSESAYNKLVQRIEHEFDENSQKAQNNETEIIKVARRLGLSPRPSGKHPDLWQANCPEAITRYSLRQQRTTTRIRGVAAKAPRKNSERL